MFGRSGLCSFVSSLGVSERIVTMCVIASILGVIVKGKVGGMGVVLEFDSRCRSSMDLFRKVVMSLLTVLGHSLLRCLVVGLTNGALVGKSCVAILRPSASKSCIASAAAMTWWRVLGSILGRGVCVAGSGGCNVVRRVLRFCIMVGVCKLVADLISSFHCVSNGCGIGKWNFMGCDVKLSCVVVGIGGWVWCMRGRCISALMPSWSKNACAMLHVSRFWGLTRCGW